MRCKACKMGAETFRTNLNTLKEMILDEEKLVTYVSISKEFCIHVNESKTLMIEAVEEIRKMQPDTVLNINYVISGLANDNKACTYVCTESDISDHRNRFKVLFFEHIYSINKGKPSEDKVAFMAITKFEDYHLCSGLIKSNMCSKRTSDEIGKLRSRIVVLEIDQKTIKPNNDKEIKANIATRNGNVETNKAPEIKSETTIKQEKISPKKEHVSINKQKQEAKITSKPQKGIANFFSHSEGTSEKKSTMSKESEIKVKSESESTNKKIQSEMMEVDDDTKVNSKKTKNSKTQLRSTTHNDTNKKENNNTSKDSKSLTQIKKNAKVDKKRKRVLYVSDSGSDNEKDDPFVEEADVHNERMNMDSEDEIPPTPAVNTVKITSSLLNPKKRRKIVNKTYTDEDGYILTKKEEVYESMSENEDNIDAKENITAVAKQHNISPKEESKLIKTEVSPKNNKNEKKNNKKKILPPQKGKQATLMSFFKKA